MKFCIQRMKFIRFLGDNSRPTLGFLNGDKIIIPNKPKSTDPYMDLIQFLYEAKRSKINLAHFFETLSSYNEVLFSELDKQNRLIVPVESPEVWGCGITYKRSMDARELETSSKTVYGQIYLAERPEIFFKSTPLRYVGPNAPVYIRSDSKWNAPEPELAFVVGIAGEIFGYTIANDVSSRDIEGKNPLYLPQAKIYNGSCSFGPCITLSDQIENPHNLDIKMSILRAGSEIFKGRTNTSKMKRTIQELYTFLKKDNVMPPGLVCMTGTGIVPPDDFTLELGDIVEIEIEKIGILKNPVLQWK